MAILDIYTHPEWLEDREDEDLPLWPVEALTVGAGFGWWSAPLDTDVED